MQRPSLSTRIALIIATCVVSIGNLAAQSLEPLGVSGTAAYNLIRNTTFVPEASAPISGRFSGRIAIAIRPDWYVGAAVGSWEFSAGVLGSNLQPSPDQYLSLSTSITASLYLQHYIARSPLFVRAGVGYADNHTYYPDFAAGPNGYSFVVGDNSTHPTLSAGGGIDFPLHHHLAFTLSVDYTRVLGYEDGSNAKTGLAFGTGLTLR